MNNRQILEDVYRDFFSERETAFVDEEKAPQEEISLDTLYLTDESKDLLKKIIQYMKDYHDGVEKNYLTFHILVESNDKTTIEAVCHVMEYYSFQYHYVEKNSVGQISFYKLDKVADISRYYHEHGILSFSDVDAFEMKEITFQKAFFHDLEEFSNEKVITIVSGKKEQLKTFLHENQHLKNLFCFTLFGIKPSVQDVYQEIIRKMHFDEEFNIQILDYITETYPKSEDSFTTYFDYLYQYLSFHKKVPTIDHEKSVEEVFQELDELVGLEKVKKALHDLVDLITLKNKTKDDLKINQVNLHMVFLGNPGTGKTTVARMISSILYHLKYIKQDKLIEVTSKDLVAEYVGQTAIKTMNVVEKAMGGILFVDEAYALADKHGDNTYNKEAIATLIKAMEDYRDNLVVIFAGYTKEMQDFLDSNSGIVSRIGYTLEFDDYTNDELIEIFKGMVEKAGFVLDSECISVVEEIVCQNRNQKNFGNARFMRNLYEKTVIQHASNTKNNKSKKILKTITKRDIAVSF